MPQLSSLYPADLRTRAAARLALLFYGFTLFVFTVAGFLRGPDSFRESLQIGLPMMMVDGLLGFQIYWLLRRGERMAQVPRWALLGSGVVLIVVLQSLWDTQLRIWADTVTDTYRTPYLAFVRSATLNTYNTGMFAALLAFQASNHKLREHQRLLIASQASERDAHMLALRFQLNPHFLFNTLNAISSLVVVGRDAEAEAMIDRLSSFLRASLTADPHTLSTVDEEFEMLESYLDIESVRFGERLRAEIELAPELAGATLPPFLLQPIVENAIKYAVAPSKRPVTVRIAAARRGDTLLLTVADDGDGPGCVTSGTGVGLANVQERLRLNYGADAHLDRRQDGGGCRVEIGLPLFFAPRSEPMFA